MIEIILAMQAAWLDMFSLSPSNKPRTQEEIQKIRDDYQALIEPHIIRYGTANQGDETDSDGS